MNLETNTNNNNLLNSDLTEPAMLDQLWEAYINTKNTDFVLKIISVLDWEDNARKYLEAWVKNAPLSELTQYIQKLSDWFIPVNPINRTIDGPVDLDIHIALLALNEELNLNELPVQIPQEGLIKLTMKNAALWSLSMSQQHPEVAEICNRESQVAGGASRIHLAID